MLGKFLHIFDWGLVRTDPAKVETIQKFKQPTIVKELYYIL